MGDFVMLSLERNKSAVCIAKFKVKDNWVSDYRGKLLTRFKRLR